MSQHLLPPGSVLAGSYREEGSQKQELTLRTFEQDIGKLTARPNVCLLPEFSVTPLSVGSRVDQWVGHVAYLAIITHSFT